MEAMIKYYEGETLGLGGKTAGSPGAGPRSPAAPAPYQAIVRCRRDLQDAAIAPAKRAARLHACWVRTAAARRVARRACGRGAEMLRQSDAAECTQSAWAQRPACTAAARAGALRRVVAQPQL
jgi:hypothetical protein